MVFNLQHFSEMPDFLYSADICTVVFIQKVFKKILLLTNQNRQMEKKKKKEYKKKKKCKHVL